MTTKTMNISLPREMKNFVEERLVNDGYSTVSEYVRELIREDQKSRDKSELEKLLLKRLKGNNRNFSFSEVKAELKKKLSKK